MRPTIYQIIPHTVSLGTHVTLGQDANLVKHRAIKNKQ